MRAARHRTPSRVRYAAAHPTIGIHVDVATRARFEALREKTGLSYTQLILTALGELELDVDAARSRGWNDAHEEVVEESYLEGYSDGYDEGHENGEHEGYLRGLDADRVTYSCARCGKDLMLWPGGADADAAVARLQQERWRHDDPPCSPA
jgi:hypothetical protein